MLTDIRYALSGDIHIAYEVIGDGPIDLVLAPTYAAHPTLDSWGEEPLIKRAVERLASFSRLILLEPRGMGLSDRMGGPPTLEQAGDDFLAVLDAVGSERAAIFASDNAALYAMFFAATFPERLTGIVLYGAYAATTWSPDYPLGTPPEHRAAEIDLIVASWGTGLDLDFIAPSEAGNQRFREWWINRQRRFASPGVLKVYFKMIEHTDMRDVLPAIKVPTLVLHRKEDPIVSVENGRFLAERIPGAKLVEVEGLDHMPFVGDWDALADEIEEFFTGARRPRDTDRVLATVLFTDIVGSTEKAAELGDHRWRDLLDEHDRLTDLSIAQFGGRKVKATGDGILATFDGPARAVRCALAIHDAARPLGLQLRAGIHTGEIELRGADVGGIAVNIGARVSALAAPGEVLVSSTVKDLVAGSGLHFSPRGEHALKGVPEEWRLFLVD